MNVGFKTGGVPALAPGYGAAADNIYSYIHASLVSYVILKNMRNMQKRRMQRGQLRPGTGKIDLPALTAGIFLNNDRISQITFNL